MLSYKALDVRKVAEDLTTQVRNALAGKTQGVEILTTQKEQKEKAKADRPVKAEQKKTKPKEIKAPTAAKPAAAPKEETEKVLVKPKRVELSSAEMLKKAIKATQTKALPKKKAPAEVVSSRPLTLGTKVLVAAKTKMAQIKGDNVAPF